MYTDYITLFFLAIAFGTILFLKNFIPKQISLFKIKYGLSFFDKKDTNGYVYIISNEAFKDDIVKIGMTNRRNYKNRLKELFNTSIPYPFNVEYIIPHSNPGDLEKQLHSYFRNHRLSSRREFFHIEKSLLKKELKGLKLI